MVEIHSPGFSPCHDLVVWRTTSPDLRMTNQDIWFPQGCTLIGKVYFKLKQQTSWLASRHFGLLSNQKFPFAKNSSVKTCVHVWMSFLDAALIAITLVSACITPTSVCLASDTSHGSLSSKVPRSSLAFITLPHSLRCLPWIHSWKTITCPWNSFLSLFCMLRYIQEIG